jgi:hypothetical protein
VLEQIRSNQKFWRSRSSKFTSYSNTKFDQNFDPNYDQKLDQTIRSNNSINFDQ